MHELEVLARLLGFAALHVPLHLRDGRRAADSYIQRSGGLASRSARRGYPRERAPGDRSLQRGRAPRHVAIRRAPGGRDRGRNRTLGLARVSPSSSRSSRPRTPGGGGWHGGVAHPEGPGFVADGDDGAGRPLHDPMVLRCRVLDVVHGRRVLHDGHRLPRQAGVSDLPGGPISEPSC